MTIGSAVLGFAVVAGLLTIVPGLDTALVLRGTVTRGRTYGLVTALGVLAGVLVWGAGAAAGVSALLTASQIAYTVVRVAGAAYLVYLGARLLVTAVRRPREVGSAEPDTSVAAAPSRWDGFRRGFLTNLLNPKIGAFYVAVLPQFLPDVVEPLLMGLLLALVHDALGLAWFVVLVLAADAMRRFLHRPVVTRLVDGVTGSVLVAFGLRLALVPER